MGKPRVIFVNRVYWPSLAATAQLLTDLAEGLVARGWTVHVIAAGTDPEPHHGVVVHRTGEGEQHGGMISQARNYWRFIRRVRKEIASLARPGDIVVVMTDPPLLGATVTLKTVKTGARVIHWIQDIYPEIVSVHFGRPAGWPLFPLRLKRDAAWHSALRCVVLGETMARKVAGHGVPPSRIVTIPNWAPRELQAAASPLEVEDQRVAWGLANKFIVAYSGNLGRVHEFDAILGAAEILRERPDIVFLFIGTGARLADVRRAMDKRKLSNIQIRPPAPRDKLAASLAAADVQVVTLKPAYAPLVYPSKLAGALAAGRPLIFVGPPDGEIAQVLRDSQCGICIAPSDSAGLAKTIIQWQANPQQRRATGAAARIAYNRNFTFESALLRWENILAADHNEPRP